MSATDFVNGRSPLGTTDDTFYNASGSDIPANTLVKVDASNVMGASQGAPGVAITTAVTDKAIGVTVEVIKSKGYGRVATVSGTRAWCIVDAAGAITAGAVVGPSGTVNGAVVAYTATDPYFGVALTTSASTADPILVQIRPGVTA